MNEFLNVTLPCTFLLLFSCAFGFISHGLLTPKAACWTRTFIADLRLIFYNWNFKRKKQFLIGKDSDKRFHTLSLCRYLFNVFGFEFVIATTFHSCSLFLCNNAKHICDDQSPKVRLDEKNLWLFEFMWYHCRYRSAVLDVFRYFVST